MAGEHRQDEQEQAGISTQPQCRSKEDQQEGQSAADYHPEKAFLVHVNSLYKAKNKLFQLRSIEKLAFAAP